MKGLRHTLLHAYPHLLSLFDELVEKHKPESVLQLMGAMNREAEELQTRLGRLKMAKPSEHPEPANRQREGRVALDNVQEFDATGIRVYAEIKKKAEAAAHAQRAKPSPTDIQRARQLIELAERARDYEKAKWNL